MTKQDAITEARNAFAKKIRAEMTAKGMEYEQAFGSSKRTYTWNEVADEIAKGTPQGKRWFKALQTVQARKAPSPD